jgi:hypothetical protein
VGLTQEEKFQRKTTATAFAIHLAREKFYGTVQGTNSCKSLSGSKLNVHQNLRHPIPSTHVRNLPPSTDFQAVGGLA